MNQYSTTLPPHDRRGRGGRPRGRGINRFGVNAAQTLDVAVQVLRVAEIENGLTDDVESWGDLAAPASAVALAVARDERGEIIEAFESGSGDLWDMRVSMTENGPPYRLARVFAVVVPDLGRRLVAIGLDGQLVLSDLTVLHADGLRTKRLEDGLDALLRDMPADVPELPRASLPTRESFERKLRAGSGYVHGGAFALELAAAQAVIDGDGEQEKYERAIARLLLPRRANPGPALNILRSAADRSPRRRNAWRAALPLRRTALAS